MTDLAPTPNSLTILRHNGVLDRNSREIFQTAVETVTQALDLPIAWIWLLDHRDQKIEIQQLTPKDASLSLTGFDRDNKPSLLCTQVVETQQPLMVRDAARHPEFAHQPLVQEDGVRAYLGVPLLTHRGDCLGTLAVMDTTPRSFSRPEVTLVELAAQVAMLQLEAPSGLTPTPKPSPLFQGHPEPEPSASAIHTQLLDRFLQDLRTPLTSVMGMTSVLNREIYGPLRRKQKEYLDIIHNSGQYMLAMVEEILMLRELRELNASQPLSPVDLHMLCQQVLNILNPLASRREQQLLLSIQECDRLWTLDKPKFQQLLYHLVAHLIQISDLGVTLQVWVQRCCSNQVELSLAISDGSEGETLPESELERFGLLPPTDHSSHLVPSSQREVSLFGKLQAKPMQADDPDLGLFFACQLVHVQDGTLTIRGSATQGYRYVVTLGDRRDPHG
ncbi:GAF domain-containing sensor histidine kinase [Phormidium yuhuli AB48]|uniref:histidine kinase n=1 Tax=Phormidium yuhuli AB48 TaxID=2940671 RepID=A0ABY5ANV6_9CYAN|nr:GAF domain-containing sensor histidine kinase [Phormidium yuhuli]USR90872.1 GAF domain-containing sensor histidine kinase [Phormidium yuhuli AB48]